MKNFKWVMALVLGTGFLANASTLRDLKPEELNSINTIIECPKQLEMALANGQWVGTGTHWENHNGDHGMTFNFFASSGIGRTKKTGTLNVSRIKLINPPQDAPGFRVECEYIPSP